MASYRHYVMEHVVTGIKEYEAFIDNYLNLTHILGPGFKNMIPYFIKERIISPDEDSIEVKDFLRKISTYLKDGHTEHFYMLLKIMKNCGKSSVEELAVAMEKQLSIAN